LSSYRGAPTKLARSCRGAPTELLWSCRGAPTELLWSLSRASANLLRSLNGPPGRPPLRGGRFSRKFRAVWTTRFSIKLLNKNGAFRAIWGGEASRGGPGGGQENGNLNISVEVSQKLRFWCVFRPPGGALPGELTFLNTYAKSFFTHRHNARAISRGLKRVSRRIWTHRQSV
jgi:hypothetical protein